MGPVILMHMYLTNAILCDKYIPCCQITVDEALDSQVCHSSSNLPGVTQQSWGKLSGNRIIWTGMFDSCCAKDYK